MGNQILQKSRAAKTKAVADVVFCFDCTGSMSDCIDNVKEYANAFVTGLNAEQGAVVDWRMRALGYGDMEIGEKIQNENDFVDNVPGFQSQLSSIAMCGGGDAPESTLDAIIVAAMTSKWRKAHKIVVVFTDAPTKPIHSSTRKTFAINGIQELKQRLADAHIKLFLWGPSDPNYEELKMVPKSEISILHNPHADFRSENKMERLLELMGKTVSEVISSDVL